LPVAIIGSQAKVNPGRTVKQMKRREFIKSSIAVAGMLWAGPIAGLAREEKSRVFVARGGGMEATFGLLRHLEGMDELVSKGARVLLKPNFSFSNPPEDASTTDPEVVKAVALWCKEAGAEAITILDNTIRSERTCLERSGIKAAADEIGDVDISIPKKERDFREVEIEAGKSLQKVEVAREYFDHDVYINLPKAKSHSATTVSFGLKNQMGLIRDRRSFHWRYDLHQAIADLATVVRPRLTILDATTALKTGGPGGPGDIVETGVVAASFDPVALDAYASTLVEWRGERREPGGIKHIADAASHGLGEMDLDLIEIVEI
jgi:uncharacterized protein (DUF362 family)